MKEVIRIQEEEKNEKPVEFTHVSHSTIGWFPTDTHPSDFEKIFYLGNDREDGDMFAAFGLQSVFIYKGHLNSGKY